MPDPAIVFIGFMGAGKSTALAAAREAGLEVIEVDDLMAEAFGKPIDEAFREDGEAAFRDRESEVVGLLLEEADGGAIALGGGSVLLDRVQGALARHIVVWLEVDPAESWHRIAGSGRPLATGEDDVRALLAERLPLYQELADVVIPSGDREIASRALPSILELRDRLPGAMMLWATSRSGEYPIFVGKGLLGRGWQPQVGKPFLIGDSYTVEQVANWKVERFAGTVLLMGTEGNIAGEASKTIDTAELILEDMADKGMTRDDYVVALGGGVVGDIAGFCAHVYQRGVSLIHLPTTLLAQVDSAYGGKTGVDLPQGKNYVGAYHLPMAVYADTKTLDTLPREELAAGFVEVVKTGLLAGGALWERVKTIEELDAAELEDVVFECARYKCAVVAADERDAGLRHVLNLGHTVGHGIEAATEYRRYRHGEAVGLGLLAALRLSGAPDLRDEVEAILERQALPLRLAPEVDVDSVLEALGRDKKRTAEGVGFVLLSEPGQPRPGQLVEEDAVRAAVEELRG